MYNLKIENDDIVFNSSMEIETVSDEDEIAQSIERTLTTRLGEFFLDGEMGMDYSELQEKNYNIDRITEDIRNAIFQDERVQSVENISVQVDSKTRQIGVQFDIIVSGNTLTGQVVI